MKKKLDYPQLVYSFLGLLALLLLNISEVKPNRIAPGERYRLYELSGLPMMIFVMGFLVLMLLSYDFSEKKAVVSGILSAILFTGILFVLGRVSLEMAKDAPTMRLSFSAGFYGILLMVYLLVGHGLSKKPRRQYLIYMGLVLSGAVVVILLTSG